MANQASGAADGGNVPGPAAGGDDCPLALAELEALLEAAPVGVAFLDRELRYLRINEALAALNGRSRADHLGRTVFEVLGDSAGPLAAVLQEVLASGQPRLGVELARARPDEPSDVRTLLANFFPVRDASGDSIGVGGVIADITERRRAEDALRDEQLRLQSILDHTPAAIWVKDPDGRVVVANRRLAAALGRSLEGLLGQRSTDVLPLDVAAEHRGHDLTVAREGRAIEVEETVPSADGARTFLSIKFPIPGDPPLVGGIATDITERKQMEDRLRAAIQARDDVLAVVSHDLRNPLGTIELSSNLLGAEVVGDGRIRRHLEVIHRSCVRMRHLIDDLVDMASIGAGRLAMTRRRERADDIAREAAELHRVLADEKGVALEQNCSAGETWVECDRERVLQVFANLLGNAIKFCRPGDAITVTCARAGDEITYTVADTGPGIDRAHLPHLFERYWSGARKKSGAGLGLFISRGIIERHGGRIVVDSAPGEGARFTFSLPIAS